MADSLNAPLRKNFYKIFEEKTIDLIVDENFFVVAASGNFYSFFPDKTGLFRPCLKDFFTINGLNNFVENQRNGYESFETEFESLNGKVWIAKVKSIFSPTKKRLFLIRLLEKASLKRNGESFSEELSSMAFLLMGLAHEIKNPLAGIKVLVDMIECECEPQDDIKGYLSKISKNVDRVNSMLEVFFSYAKSDSQKKEIFSVSSLLEDLRLFEGYRIKKEGIEFVVDTENRELYLIANRNNVLDIFLNLLHNALDSVLASGTILRRIELKVFETDIPSNFSEECILSLNIDKQSLVGVAFVLEDNGIGMDDFEKKHIFNPFFTTKDSGVGLGMSMVAKYLEENCGEISIESAKGRGSRFTVVLPGIKGY